MSRIKSKIESLLFISAKPMSTKQLAGLLKAKEADVKKAGEELVEEYVQKKGGIQIIKNASKFQMVSSADNAKLIQDFLSDETSGELSRPSMETLTIIAYRGPISKVSLDRIRGVNCSLILRNLLLRGLVELKEEIVETHSNASVQEKEPYYTVSFDFIRFLGINKVEELPDFEKLHKDDTIDRMLEDDDDQKENVK